MPSVLERHSKDCTLHPSDIIVTGAPEQIKSDDVLELDILGIGVPRNPVVEEE